MLLMISRRVTMKNRTTQPKNNKYYIRTVSGGLNGAVAGKPTIKGANVLANCVGYANGRFNEIINDPDLKGINKAFRYQLVCNAENFIEAAKSKGLKVSSVPYEGGIMVWRKGKTLKSSDGAGHVAIVEQVYDDGTILTSESGYGSADWAFKMFRRSNSNGRWGQGSAYTFRGCIINPSVKNPKIVPVPKLIVDGVGGTNTVRALQKFLGTPQDGVISGQDKKNAKFFPALKAVEYGTKGSIVVQYLQKWLGLSQSGQWNEATSKALQTKLGVTADGSFGTNSMKALQKYLNENDKAVFPPSAPKPSATPAKQTSGEKLCVKAKTFCWPYGTDPKKWRYKTGSALPIYKDALKKYMKKTAKISQSDCGYFIDVCVRSAGFGNSFNVLDWKAKLPSTMKIVHSGSKVPSGLLKPGDIIRYKKTNKMSNGAYSQHTLMYYGSGKIAEAGRSTRFPVIESDAKKYNAKNVQHKTIQVIRVK